MPMRFVRRTNSDASAGAADEDPLAGIANLFDVSVAFIVALLIALFALFSSGSLLDPNSKMTIVKQSDNGDMEIITKDGPKIKVEKVTDKKMAGQGERLGVAYRLGSGQVIYVPESSLPASSGPKAGQP
jgi:hypothetical protein